VLLGLPAAFVVLGPLPEARRRPQSQGANANRKGFKAGSTISCSPRGTWAIRGGEDGPGEARAG
jgi:hypothetical protein